MFKNWTWKPPSDWKTIKTIDLHTCGEPLRVFTDGLPEIKGNTILKKRKYFRDNLDYLRTGIMWEPRGHADMYGAIITEPVSDDADFGTFFLHNEGYSTMCGHAMIALVTLVLETGLIKKDSENPEIIIDAPPGKIFARGHIKDGRVLSVSFRNVPSFLLLKDKTVYLPGFGEITFDVAFGGAFYAFVKSKDLELELDSGSYDKLINYGRKIKHAVMDNYEIKHPFEEDLSFLYGTIFTGASHNKNNHSRNVCIFADGEVDRSPTGSGVSARAALHHSKDELKTGEIITIESILGSLMDVKIVNTTRFGPYNAVIPEVRGTASITGKNEFYFDPDDPFKEGFILR